MKLAAYVWIAILLAVTGWTSYIQGKRAADRWYAKRSRIDTTVNFQKSTKDGLICNRQDSGAIPSLEIVISCHLSKNYHRSVRELPNHLIVVMQP